MIDSATSSPDFAANLRRLMARRGVTLLDVVRRSGLDQRTISGVLTGRCRPHARTLHKLAQGLQVPADELFEAGAGDSRRRFDRETNPLVDEILCAEPALFAGWTAADFDELYSRFGTGGALAEEGVRQAAEQMNRNRELHHRVALILESDQRELLFGFVELLYRQVSVFTRDEPRRHRGTEKNQEE